MVFHSMTQVGKWSRRIGGGALVLALAGLSAPATTSAATRIVGHEVIPVEGEAPEVPWKPPIWMGGHDGTGASNYDSSGGDSGGGGPVYGGGGGGTSMHQKIAERLAELESICHSINGSWGRAEFDDWETDIRYSGYRCVYPAPFSPNTTVWDYYDSHGNFNHTCSGDREVQVCEGP